MRYPKTDPNCFFNLGDNYPETNQIAQKNSGLIIGSNNVEQIIEATIFKIKSMVIQNILSDQSSEKIPISGQQGSLTA